jgi:hypothetical protein
MSEFYKVVRQPKRYVNKFVGECKDCGEIVPVGKGILTSEWSNQDDDTVLVVRHADKSICEAVKKAEAKEASKAVAISNGINWIKKNATSHTDDVQKGATTIYDGRKGYNSVGWLLTRTDNTLYLSSENGSDGVRWDETYILNTTASRIDDLLWAMELI